VIWNYRGWMKFLGAILEKLTARSASQEIPRLLWNTGVEYNCTHPPPYFLIILWILVSHLRLGIPKCLFLWACTTKILHIFFNFTMCATIHFIHLHFIYYPNNIWRMVQITELLLCSYLRPPVCPFIKKSLSISMKRKSVSRTWVYLDF
jgi:hypothetical protein